MDLLALHHFLGNDDQSQVMQIINLFRHIPQLNLTKVEDWFHTAALRMSLRGTLSKKAQRRRQSPNFMSVNF